MMRTLTLIAATAALLAGCGEEPQTATASTKKSDAASWKGAPDDPFVAQGWNQGDKASWQKQIRERTQKQNEYTRVQ